MLKWQAYNLGMDRIPRMKYVGILVALGVITSVVGLSLAQAAISLPQKIRISTTASKQKITRVQQIKIASPVPTLAPVSYTHLMCIRDSLWIMARF